MNDRYGPSTASIVFATLFWPILGSIAAGLLIWFMAWGAQAGHDEREVWNDSCTHRGGIVVSQYRADDWCVKDGIIIDSGDGN